MRTLTACAAALSFLFVHAPRVNAADAEPAGSIQVKALSFNIRYGSARDGANNWDSRRELAFKVARDGGYDFIGMQEAEPFQIEQFAEALPGYGYWSRSRELDPESGEACPIFYRKDTWTLDDIWHGVLWLSDTPKTPGSKSWGNSIPRIITWGRFKHNKTGQELLFLNTHFDHQSQPSRLKSAEALLKEIDIFHRPWQHLIVTGDFNAGEDNPAIRKLNEGFKDAYGVQQKLIDTFRVKHPDAKEVGTFNSWRGETGGAKIDYVFMLSSSDAKVREARIIHTNEKGRYPSDHFPVDATIELPVRKSP